MKIIGVTGRIASGKNTFISCFIKHYKFYKHINVFDADNEAKLLYKNEKVIELFKKKLPFLTTNNDIDFNLLKQSIFNNIKINKTIKEILYPLLYKKIIEYIKISRVNGCRILFLNIPLIYELKIDLLCDEIYIIKCSFFRRYRRLIKRNGDTRIFKLEKNIPYRQKINENKNCNNKIIYNSSKNDMLNYLKNYLKFI